MADQFGVQLQELAKIQSDFQKINSKMTEMSQRVGAIKNAVAKAAATDVTAGGLLGVANFFAVAAQVASKVKDISDRADALEKTKKQLTEELGQDAQKIKQVLTEYKEIERKIEEALKKPHQGQEQPKGPHTGIDGTGGGKGGGNHGGGGHTGGGDGGGHTGGGGGHTGGGGNHGGSDDSGSDGSGISTRPGGRHDGPKIKDRSRGDWQTHIINGSGWDSWSDHWHRHNGQGVGPKDQPILDGASDERKAMVDRAMERVNRKLGYSQGAETNGYRVDCSGFVSAAWGLPGPGTTTGPLISESGGIAHHISKSSMLPGDAMVVHQAHGEQHVVLFGGWADKAHTRMVILEDNGSLGCVSREVPLSKYSEYTAVRKNGM
ncbi:hypothetical protein BX265_3219 [Streptomyces sp. TLI_235]|nr:hypothetical protein [Streptomyces sp. TLI_235]PBC78448.1 hypothetical protein BX265_3219 [Streptomyces sp. TLI_235]